MGVSQINIQITRKDKSMHAKYIIMFLMTLVCLSSMSTASEKETPLVIPDTHPIHKPLGRGPESARFYKKGTKPQFEFSLKKNRYNLGEPIEGTFVVSKEGGYAGLAAPYRGYFTSTVEVWVSKQQKTEDRISWSDLKCVLPMSIQKKIRYASNPLAGCPVFIKSGTGIKRPILLNRLQTNAWDDPTLRGIPAPIFHKPGTYRIYLRYTNLASFFNLEKMRAWLMLQENLTKEKAKTTPFYNFPNRPVVVLGPYEIEIRSRPKDTFPTRETMEAASSLVSYLNHDRPFLNNEAKKTIQSIVEKYTESEPSTAAFWELSLIQQDIAVEIRRAIIKQGKYSHAALLPILKRTRLVSQRLEPSALQDMYRLTEASILHLVGKREQAYQLAKKIDTPDSRAQIHYWEQYDKQSKPIPYFPMVRMAISAMQHKQKDRPSQNAKNE
jgi:hypothetical protein